MENFQLNTIPSSQNREYDQNNIFIRYSLYPIYPLLSFQQINNPKATANLHNKYALIINGGIDKENNHLRYWNNCSAFYSALTKIYGYSKSNITTLMADDKTLKKIEI